MKLVVTTLLTAAAACPNVALAQTDLGPLNLPSMSTTLPMDEGFEAAAGVVPPYMALTNLDVASMLPDAEAWCNIGQLAPCITPFDGAYNLEMGLMPGSTNYHDVRNAMVIGIDATGYGGSLDLSFMGINMGEETDPVDGVWVSDDGSNWYMAWGPWGTFSTNVWTHTGLIPLDGTPANTSGVFYVAFVQEDNFPYDDLDGAGVDEIAIPGVPAPPEFSVDTLTGGLYTTLTVNSDFPGRPCYLLASLTGGGPTMIGLIELDLSQPIQTIALLDTDLNGTVVHSLIVPLGLTGTQVWLQALVVDIGAGHTSNSVTQTVR